MSWTQDLRFALRMVRKNPWFSAAIIVTLALGIGANTTVFSLVNAVLRKPLPFPGGERLVIIRSTQVTRGDDTGNLSYLDFRDLREAARGFERMEVFQGMGADISEQGNPPERFRGGRVSAGMFDMIHMQPALGRGVLPADQKPGSEGILVLGYGVWSSRYHKDPAVLGRTVRVNEKPAVIVGVMPEGFKFPNNEDLWMAAVPNDQAEKRGARDYLVIGMLKPGVTITEAQASLTPAAQRLEQQYPDTNKGYGTRIQTFHEVENGGPIRLVFLLMLGAVGFVLLIACANVANMLLSRAVGRAREMSIRAAIGASRWRVVRQLLIESVLLSLTGGVFGLLLARAGIRAFSLAVENVGKPYWIDFSMDYVVFLYFAAVSVAAGILFGLAPALQASKVNLNETLKEGSRSAGGRRSGYLSGALVVLQFTLAVVLLSAAGLMVRSFLLAQDEFAALHAGRIATARVNVPPPRYGKPEQRQQFFEQLLPRLAAIPGAQAAALVSNLPGSGAASWRFELAGHEVDKHDQRPAAAVLVASAGYFDLLGLKLQRGRDFEPSDGLPGKEVVIVSRTFAERHFPNQDPLGKQIHFFPSENQPKPWMTIVGVVPDIHQNDANQAGGQQPLVVVPYRTDSRTGMSLLVRGGSSGNSLVPALRREVQQMDELLPLFDVGTVQDFLERSRWYLRVFGTVFFLFALIAMGMASVGIYAVMAHSTGSRTQEIGIRMALGANVATVLRLVLIRGLKQLFIGMVLGLAAAIAVCRLMGRLLFQVSPQDPATFTLVTLVLLIAGFAACWVPAHRAARLDAVRALRHE